MEHSPTLKRTLGIAALTIYGVGDILGAGIYALTGKVAGMAGEHAWLAFLGAMLVAGVTACTYAEMSARYPHSGGAAYFCLKGFGNRPLSLLIGWLVLCSGVVSIAAGSRAFSGYVRSLAPALPEPLLIVLFVAGVGGIAFWGIRESSVTNMICTFVEGSGLMIVLVGALVYIASDAAPAELPVQAAPSPNFSWAAIAGGAALAFYAFIGFEDLVNLADEARAPQRHLPFAILGAMLVTGAVYVAVAAVATRVMSPEALGASEAPLLDVVRHSAPAIPPLLFTLIALFAVTNTALMNFVMGSRLIYGLAREGLLPPRLGQVHARTQTPHIAILVVVCGVLVLGLMGSIQGLAGTTSALLLSVFALVHIALVAVKRRGEKHSGFRVPLLVPVVGIVCCTVLIYYAQNTSLAVGATLLLLGVALVAWRTWAMRLQKDSG